MLQVIIISTQMWDAHVYRVALHKKSCIYLHLMNIEEANGGIWKKCSSKMWMILRGWLICCGLFGLTACASLCLRALPGSSIPVQHQSHWLLSPPSQDPLCYEWATLTWILYNNWPIQSPDKSGTITPGGTVQDNKSDYKKRASSRHHIYSILIFFCLFRQLKWD